jgi:hypothetical protein
MSTALASFATGPPNSIQLLNQDSFDATNFRSLVELLQKDPSAALQRGSHQRSTIWVCCRHSEYSWRRTAVVMILLQYGANVNQQAGNGYTPL